MTLLEKIAEVTRDKVATLRRAGVSDERESDVRPFADALRDVETAVIAEIKKASPSRGVIREDFDVPSLARAYADGGAACLSVLTDEVFFQGSLAYLAAARDAAALPTLRKDFIIDPLQVAQSYAAGADAILLIVAMLDDARLAALHAAAREYGMDVLVETHDEAEMARAAELGAEIIGINNRNLHDFTVDLAVTERLARHAPPGAVLVSESGIFTPGDVARVRDAGAAAVLVGESLMRCDDVAAAVRRLRGDT